MDQFNSESLIYLNTEADLRSGNIRSKEFLLGNFMADLIMIYT